jgi:hypothetical protein
MKHSLKAMCEIGPTAGATVAITVLTMARDDFRITA